MGIIIAIDGHSSTGKSTVARKLAQRLGYIYVDTGAMYRGVTLFALQNNLIQDGRVQVDELINRLHDINLEFVHNPKSGDREIHLNGTNVEGSIRGMDVSEHVSPVAAIPEVRYQLVKQQQKFGQSGEGVVMDGRDIGTVVFPTADLKLFMTADAQVRAQRRYDELIARGGNVDYNEVLKNVRERDYIDSNRADSPLVQAQDAVVIDNTNMDRDEQFARILELVDRAIQHAS